MNIQLMGIVYEDLSEWVCVIRCSNLKDLWNANIRYECSWFTSTMTGQCSIHKDPYLHYSLEYNDKKCSYLNIWW